MKPAHHAKLAVGLAAAMIAAPSAPALDVFNYSAAANERFSSGFPSAPVANSSGSFIGAGLNFSGVGWQTANSAFAVTMVSPMNFLAARHASPSATNSVSFLGQDGQVHSYAVASITTIEYSSGVLSDLVVGTLTQAVASDITYYPSIYLGSNLASYLGLNLAVYGQGGTVGWNSISGFATADFIPQDSVVDSLFSVMDYNSVTGGTVTLPAATQGESGDSSSPSFVLVGANLAVIGVHSAINTASPPNQTYDTFIPAYLADINSVLAASGYSLLVYTAVPEPSGVALILSAGAACAVAWRRARRAKR